MWVANSSITSPTRKAVSPEIPVSISSKINVGSEVCLASRPLTASISLDNSPPEATLPTGAGGCPAFAVNNKSTSFIPFAFNCACVDSLKVNAALGMLICFSALPTSFSTTLIAFLRLPSSSVAFLNKSVCKLAIFF